MLNEQFKQKNSYKMCHGFNLGLVEILSFSRLKNTENRNRKHRLNKGKTNIKSKLQCKRALVFSSHWPMEIAKQKTAHVNCIN